MHLRSGLGRAQRTGHGAGAVDPLRRRHAMPTAHAAALARGHHEGVEPAVPVVGTQLARELGVQREGGARQRAKRRAVAPVERQKSARLARRRARDPRPLDHRDPNATERQKIRDRRPHDASPADHNMPRRRHR